MDYSFDEAGYVLSPGTERWPATKRRFADAQRWLVQHAGAKSYWDGYEKMVKYANLASQFLLVQGGSSFTPAAARLTGTLQ